MKTEVKPEMFGHRVHIVLLLFDNFENLIFQWAALNCLA